MLHLRKSTTARKSWEQMITSGIGREVAARLVSEGWRAPFDMLLPWQEQSKAAKRRLCEEYERHMMKDR